MKILRLGIVLALVGAVVVAAVQFVQRNELPVTVDLWFTVVPDVALWLLLLAAFGLGAAVVGLLSLFELARQALVARRYRRAAARLESEIHQLRTLPLADAEPVPPGERDAASGPGGAAAGRG